jgi:flagellar biosynthesis/type III secretory pathway chaperone
MNSEAQIRLEDLLDREIEIARSLAATLDTEKTALTGESATEVEQLAEEKIRLFNVMEKLEQERRTICENPGATGMTNTIATRWRSLIALMAHCRSANELNGHIIRVRQHQIRQLIDIVRGKPAATTYNPQGKTFAKALRALARA